MFFGARVVRGRDWASAVTTDSIPAWNCVGTIVSVNNFQHGGPLPSETVLVDWDTGEQTCCRAGKDGCYDLRVFDSAPAGLKFEGVVCAGCKQSGIAGMLWHCGECPDLSLCTMCYMKDVHDTSHSFVRFDSPSDLNEGFEVGKRSTSFKVPSKGLFPGAKVRTRKDMEWSWTSPTLIGGEVLKLVPFDNIPRCVVQVKWGEVSEQMVRLGYQGKVDVEVVDHSFADGPSYYENHLPMVSVDGHLRLISRIVGCEGGITWKEIRKEGENAINYLNDLLSTCNFEGRAEICKCKGEIQKLMHAFEYGPHESLALIQKLQMEEQESHEMEDASVNSTPEDVMKDDGQSPGRRNAVTDRVNRSADDGSVIRNFSTDDTCRWQGGIQKLIHAFEYGPHVSLAPIQKLQMEEQESHEMEDAPDDVMEGGDQSPGRRNAVTDRVNRSADDGSIIRNVSTNDTCRWQGGIQKLKHAFEYGPHVSLALIQKPQIEEQESHEMEDVPISSTPEDVLENDDHSPVIKNSVNDTVDGTADDGSVIRSFSNDDVQKEDELLEDEPKECQEVTWFGSKLKKISEWIFGQYSS